MESRPLASFLVGVLVIVILGASASSDMSAEVNPGGVTYRGAIVDSYQKEVMLLRITSPTDIITSVTKTLDFSKMSDQVGTELKLTLGYLEKIFTQRFDDLMGTYSQALSSHYPIESRLGNSQMIEVKHKREKRGFWQVLVAFLRAVRPVAKVGGKLTRFGKFARAMKITGALATGATMIYEIGVLTGAIPDYKYEELAAEIKKLHEAREQDISYMKNLTLATTQLSEVVGDVVSQFNTLVIEMPSIYEIKLQGSILLTSYLSSLQYSLSLLAMGRIPTSLISLDTQRLWLEKKLPSPLLSSIGSISPHLRVKLANIDPSNNVAILTVEVPRVDTRFQLMNFAEWEPMFFHEGICYTSPIPKLYLGYPVGLERESRIRDPLIFDPQSCMDEGFILCESDSVLSVIPQVEENRICTKYNKVSRRTKRSLEDLYLDAQHPTYDISGMINTTLDKKMKPIEHAKDISDLMKKISLLEESAKMMKHDAERNLEQAKSNQHWLFICLFGVCAVLLPMFIYIAYIAWKFFSTCLKDREEKELEKIRMRIMSAHMNDN